MCLIPPNTGTRNLGEFVYCFNRRFRLETLPLRLLVAAVTVEHRPASWLRQAEESLLIRSMKEDPFNQLGFTEIWRTATN